MRGVVLLRMILIALSFMPLVPANCLPTQVDRQGSDRDAEAMQWLEGLLRAQNVQTDSDSLIKALAENKEVIVRSTAAQILGLRKEVKASAALKAALESDPEAVVKESAALALAHMGDPAGRDALKKLIPQSPDLKRRSVLAGNLAELGDPGSYSFVVQAVTSDNAETRRLSAASLFPFLKYEGRRENGQVIDPLKRLLGLLQDKEPGVRSEALIVLNRAVPTYISRELLKPKVEKLGKQDPDRTVRATADRILQTWELMGPQSH
jgi:HEAT repeat protein